MRGPRRLTGVLSPFCGDGSAPGTGSRVAFGDMPGDRIEADARIPSGETLQYLFGSGIASARGARTQVPLDALLGTTTRLLFDL
ncbi:hypothetical protein [Streptomyces sp. NPDC047453]|uniref:hypothetical protein n=1 Tax=Streptomyces sp. NPDC047453 TaxID=3154812 RepID=UPI0033E30935